MAFFFLEQEGLTCMKNQVIKINSCLATFYPKLLNLFVFQIKHMNQGVKMSLLAKVTIFGLCVSLCNSSQRPEFSPQYSVQGMISMPYAEIEEPFSAWVNLEAGKSRMDFYGGSTKIFQISDEGQYGAIMKLVPMTTEKVTNEMNCFKSEGGAEDLVKPQSILPSMEGFELKGNDTIEGQPCQKWRKVETVGQKVNKYTIWTYPLKSKLSPKLKVWIPLRFQMKGYNILMGSHYDHYYITYVVSS